VSKINEFYLSIPNAGDKKLYVPRVEDKNSHMRMLNISRIDDLVANSMNILEPTPVDADGNARQDGTSLSPSLLDFFFSFTAQFSYLTLAVKDVANLQKQYA
jgi:hypothetical protein